MLNGLCVFGQPDEHGNSATPVRDVTVSGFTIRNFAGSGIIAFGAANATFKNTSQPTTVNTGSRHSARHARGS